MGLDESTGIRDYLAYIIANLPEDVRNGRPGYKLFNKDKEEVSSDETKVNALLNEVYGNEELKPFIAIQPPSENSQLLSHMHCFMLNSVPESMVNSYIDCETILKVKQDHIVSLDQSEEEDDGCELTRQSTVRVDGGN